VLGIRISKIEIALDRGYESTLDPELRAWGCNLFKRMEKLIWKGKIKPHPIELDDKIGFGGVISGVERMKQRQVQGNIYMF